MQLKIETLEEMQSECEDELNARSLDKILSRYSSFDSLDQSVYDTHSEDLDKLSVCLSEASSDSNEGKRASLFSELLQAQLALWTLIGSIFFSYVWQQHRKKFLFSLFVVVPPVIILCITISSLLTAIVILGRIFSTPLRFEDMLKFGGKEEKYEENKNGRHWRTLSINSYQSSISANSINEEVLPRPMCRKHSASNGSLNQISNGQTSPNNYFNGMNGKSPTSHRLSYTFSHSIGGEHGIDN